jgi:prevent-host-death family protein
MIIIDISKLQSELPRLIDEIEHGHEREIVIVRNGEPVARLVPMTDPPGTARDVEFKMITRCAAVARDTTQTAENQSEANVFRLAAMVIRSRFTHESESLMRASEEYFATHPNEQLDPGDVIRRGWIVNLPRLRDMLSRELGWQY